jgi:hypothetical protein
MLLGGCPGAQSASTRSRRTQTGPTGKPLRGRHPLAILLGFIDATAPLQAALSWMKVEMPVRGVSLPGSRNGCTCRTAIQSRKRQGVHALATDLPSVWGRHCRCSRTLSTGGLRMLRISSASASARDCGCFDDVYCFPRTAMLPRCSSQETVPIRTMLAWQVHPILNGCRVHDALGTRTYTRASLKRRAAQGAPLFLYSGCSRPRTCCPGRKRPHAMP